MDCGSLSPMVPLKWILLECFDVGLGIFPGD